MNKSVSGLVWFSFGMSVSTAGIENWNDTRSGFKGFHVLEIGHLLFSHTMEFSCFPQFPLFPTIYHDVWVWGAGGVRVSDLYPSVSFVPRFNNKDGYTHCGG